MWERRAGSVLVIDDQKCLSGIFTGRDAGRAVALPRRQWCCPHAFDPGHSAGRQSG